MIKLAQHRINTFHPKKEVRLNSKMSLTSPTNLEKRFCLSLFDKFYQANPGYMIEKWATITLNCFRSEWSFTILQKMVFSFFAIEFSASGVPSVCEFQECSSFEISFRNNFSKKLEPIKKLKEMLMAPQTKCVAIHSIEMVIK